MIVTQTPLRISFFGGGTDFANFYQQEDGCVLSTAIDKFIYVIVKSRFDEKIRLGYTRTELVNHVDEIQHELAREAMKLTGVVQKIEIDTIGDIPASGSGLGSSSTVTVGILHALFTARNQPSTHEQLAQFACKIEIDILNKPIGKQDQYIATYGGLRFIRFLPDGSVAVESLNLNAEQRQRLNERLMLFYTNTGRKSANILVEQNQNIVKNIQILRTLKEFAQQGRSLLESERFDDFGLLLHEGWTLKKKLASKISNHHLDEIYHKARQAGALGGKITGAGGGGYILLYCPCDLQDQIREALAPLKELPFQLEADGSKVIFNYQR